MKAALKEAIEQIKTAGFSHIKVELEGDIGRDGERECQECYGSGELQCSNCEGGGYVHTMDDNNNEYENECADCSGDGEESCDACDGSGNSGSFMDEETCEDFMRQWIREKHPGAEERLTYGNFYEDGSVDSEFTFTVPIENVEDVLLWTEAFKALAYEAGDGNIDVSGAGLHVSVLPATSNGRYPCGGQLPESNLNNFMNEVTKLLPALFFLASSGHQSRDLGYRHASIGYDKYHAISTHDATSLEYRVFETCYDRPEAFYDYVKVIANTLKFYADPSLKVSALGKTFGFNDGNECARFFSTPEQLRILNATVKHLKPKDKSFKKLKEERGVRYTIKSLASKEKAKIAQLREDYRIYRRNYLETRSRPLTERELADVDRYMVYESWSRRQAEAYVRGDTAPLMSLADFITKNLRPSHYSETVSV